MVALVVVFLVPDQLLTVVVLVVVAMLLLDIVVKVGILVLDERVEAEVVSGAGIVLISDGLAHAAI